MKRFFAALALMLAGFCVAAGAENAQFPDGIYRGTYYEGGIEQIAIEFELRDGAFASIEYLGVRYKDGDYMIKDASDAQKATLRQYDQLAQYLIGRDIEAIDALYTPYDIVEDMDAVTSATMQSSKLISALWDGLNRRPFALTATSELPGIVGYADGEYRGIFMEDGAEQVAVRFTVRGDAFADIAFETLKFGGVDYLNPVTQVQAQISAQYHALAAYLTGRPLTAINDLYAPESIISDADISSGATICAPKVISALWDGLNRRAYRID